MHENVMMAGRYYPSNAFVTRPGGRAPLRLLRFLGSSIQKIPGKPDYRSVASWLQRMEYGGKGLFLQVLFNQIKKHFRMKTHPMQ
jgi:hypothetical protein